MNSQWTIGSRWPMFGPVFSRVIVCTAFERSGCSTVARAERLVDPGRMEREVLADVAGVDGDARVLADEVLLLVGDVDVPVDRLQDALPRDRGLAVLAAARASRRSCGMSFSAQT